MEKMKKGSNKEKAREGERKETCMFHEGNDFCPFFHRFIPVPRALLTYSNYLIGSYLVSI